MFINNNFSIIVIIFDKILLAAKLKYRKYDGKIKNQIQILNHHEKCSVFLFSLKHREIINRGSPFFFYLSSEKMKEIKYKKYNIIK